MNEQGRDTSYASPPHHALVTNCDPTVILAPHHHCLGIGVCLHASRRLEESLDDARLGVGQRTRSVEDGDGDACHIEFGPYSASSCLW